MTKLASLAFVFMLTTVAWADPQPSKALDSITVGDPPSETAHNLTGDNQTGTFQNRTWRDGALIQYTLDTHNEKAVDLVVTYWGGDVGRVFDVMADDQVLATETLNNNKPAEFYDQHYTLPASVLASAPNGKVTIKFVVKTWVAGGIFAVSLVKSPAPSSTDATSSPAPASPTTPTSSTGTSTP